MLNISVLLNLGMLISFVLILKFVDNNKASILWSFTKVALAFSFVYLILSFCYSLINPQVNRWHMASALIVQVFFCVVWAGVLFVLFVADNSPDYSSEDYDDKDYDSLK